MRTLAHMISLFAFFSLLAPGCSTEEQAPPPRQKPEVVKRMIKSEPKKTSTGMAAMREKEIERKTEEKTGEKIEIKKIQANLVLREPEGVKPPEIPAPQPGQATASGVTKTPGAPQTRPPAPAAPAPKIPEPPKAMMIEKTAAAPPAENRPEKKPEPEKERGYYIVKEGDSMARISGDVYGNPLAWPILYRYNLEKLGGTPVGPDMPDRKLQTGLKLKILTPDDIAENRQKKPKYYWVINILSATENEKIVPAAVTLVKSGYPVYITRADVKGKNYMRLRLGFFNTQQEAEAKGREIMNMMNFPDTWNTKIGERELAGFGGF